MNFKKTCKSIVSFVLGTGMMFSGSAFNNKSNAIFPEEFYMENLEKYKDNKPMTIILDFLRYITCGKDLLQSRYTDHIISSAEENIAHVDQDVEKLLVLARSHALIRCNIHFHKSKIKPFLEKTFPYLLSVAVTEKTDLKHLTTAEEILNNLTAVIKSFKLTCEDVQKALMESYSKTFGPVIEIWEFHTKNQEKYKNNKLMKHILNISRQSSSNRRVLRKYRAPEDLSLDRQDLDILTSDVRHMLDLVERGDIPQGTPSGLVYQPTYIKYTVEIFLKKTFDYLLYNVTNPPETLGFEKQATAVIDTLNKVIETFDLSWDYVCKTLQESCNRTFNSIGGRFIPDLTEPLPEKFVDIFRAISPRGLC